MNVTIKETGAKETLELIDSHGTDCAIDVIGNYDGIGSDAHQFQLDEDTGIYTCTQDTYDWWNRVLAEQQDLTDRIAELSKEYGAEAVQDAIGTSGDCDLEDQAAAINKALDAAFAVSQVEIKMNKDEVIAYYAGDIESVSFENAAFDTALTKIAEEVKGWSVYEVNSIERIQTLARYDVYLLDDSSEAVFTVRIDIFEPNVEIVIETA